MKQLPWKLLLAMKNTEMWTPLGPIESVLIERCPDIRGEVYIVLIGIK